MKKFLNFDAVFGSILISNFVSGKAAPVEETVGLSANVEDRFVGHFKANPVFYNGGWTKRILELVDEGDLETKLQELCTRAHKAAGFGDNKVDLIAVTPSVLKFDNEMYPERKILVVTYGLEGPWHDHEHKGHHYRYLTKGTRQDCLFYLDLVNPGEYKLQKEVCGIESVL